jgi:hypothetical protein
MNMKQGEIKQGANRSPDSSRRSFVAQWAYSLLSIASNGSRTSAF